MKTRVYFRKDDILSLIVKKMGNYEHDWVSPEYYQHCLICKIPVQKGTPCKRSGHYRVWEELLKLKQEIEAI